MLLLHPPEHILVKETHICFLYILLVDTNFFQDGGEVLIRMLVNGLLFVHIEHRQVIVHHQDRADIVHLDALTLRILIPPLRDIDGGIAESDDGKQIRRIEPGFLDKFPDNQRNGSCIIGKNKSDFIGLVGEVLFFQFLRNAERVV